MGLRRCARLSVTPGDRSAYPVMRTEVWRVSGILRRWMNGAGRDEDVLNEGGLPSTIQKPRVLRCFGMSPTHTCQLSASPSKRPIRRCRCYPSLDPDLNYPHPSCEHSPGHSQLPGALSLVGGRALSPDVTNLSFCHARHPGPISADDGASFVPPSSNGQAGSCPVFWHDAVFPALSMGHAYAFPGLCRKVD